MVMLAYGDAVLLSVEQGPKLRVFVRSGFVFRTLLYIETAFSYL